MNLWWSWPRVASWSRLSRRPAARRLGAFTLIELLLSVALMSFILVAAYACMRAALASRGMVESRGEIIQNARVALARLTADLRAACPLEKGLEFLGMDRTIDDVEADNLDFATHHYTPVREGESDFAEVSYFLEKDPESGEFSLWRRLDTFPDQEPLSGGSRQELVRGLQGLRFEYYDGLEWFDEWGDPAGRRRGSDQDSLLLPNNLSGMPDAVRITMSFANPESRPASSAPDERPTTRAPPLVFQTVARLNLAPITMERSANASASSVGRSNSGSDARGEGGTR